MVTSGSNVRQNVVQQSLWTWLWLRSAVFAPLINKNQDHANASKSRRRKKAQSWLFSLQITFRIFLLNVSTHWLLQLLNKKTLCFNLIFLFVCWVARSSGESLTGKFPQMTWSSLFPHIIGAFHSQPAVQTLFKPSSWPADRHCNKLWHQLKDQQKWMCH